MNPTEGGALLNGTLKGTWYRELPISDSRNFNEVQGGPAPCGGPGSSRPTLFRVEGLPLVRS